MFWKVKQQSPSAPLTQVPYSKRTWSMLAIDVLGELYGMPQQARYYIFLTDLYSKWPEVNPVSNVTSNSLIEFLSDMFSHCGLPEEIISDRGTRFVSQECEQFLKAHDIKR